MVDTCPQCLYPASHPLGIVLNGSDDLCSGCITHQEKDTLDWPARRSLLEQQLKRSCSGKRAYDCVVPVIGDAEDYYTLSVVSSLGLSPLVVMVNDYFRNDVGWHNFHNLITHFDVDSLVYNPDYRIYQDLVRTSLRKFDHILLPFLQLHTSFPVHVALKQNIPLVIWGQHQAVEQVGKFSHLDAVEMSRWSRREHDLFDVDIDHLIGNGAQVNEKHLNYYRYPETRRLAGRVRGLYLSHYLRWDPLPQNAAAVDQGFWAQAHATSFDPFERAGSSVYYGLHDLLKFKRTGQRKINDHVAREIRHQRINSEQGRRLLAHYHKVPVDIRPFFNWLGTSRSGVAWFIKHKLAALAPLINDDGAAPASQPPAMPAPLRRWVSVEQRAARENFIVFGKGI